MHDSVQEIGYVHPACLYLSDSTLLHVITMDWSTEWNSYCFWWVRLELSWLLGPSYNQYTLAGQN